MNDLAPTPPLVPLEVAQRIHQKCEQFEAAWSGPARPQLGAFLGDVAEPERTWLLTELLSLEIELRQGVGEQPTEAEYWQSFPEERDRDVITAAFRRCADSERETKRALPLATDSLVATLGLGPKGENKATHVRPGARARATVAPKIEGYEILDELGRGGMGVVYKARHLRLKRLVALKMILAGDHAGREHLARFRTEAEMVARLQHPNIVQIFDIGEQDGHPYLAFEFIEGKTLADFTGRGPQPPRVAAELLEALARAMAYAHQQGIVHRDLKPANILIQNASRQDAEAQTSQEGQDSAPSTLGDLASLCETLLPKITDFGLAKDLGANLEHTSTGAILGTPVYMAPEQAEGRRDIGPASDIYSLGAILYVLLTGRPPLQGTTPISTLKMVVSTEPVPPSHLLPHLARDLETICLKCLHKDPARRYETAGALADDLVRFLCGEPILARPVGRIERSVKWVKRNPVVTGAAIAVALALSVGATVSYQKFRETEAALVKVDDALKEEAKQRQAERWGRYRSNIAAASAALQLQNNTAVRSALDDAPEEHRNWEWQYLHSQLDGARIVIPVPTKHLDSIVVSPAVRQIAVFSSLHNDVYLYDVSTGKLDAVLRGHPSPSTSVVYRPDGKQIASSGEDAILRVWNATSGGELTQIRAESESPNPKLPTRIVYNSDGSRIASFAHSNGDVTSRLWNATTGKEIAVLALWQKDKGYGEFSPDGKRVAVGAGKNVNLCDAVTGQRLAVLGPQDEVRSLKFSPDGKRIAFLSSQATHLWDGESGKAVAVLRGHTAGPYSLRFSPDGSRLISGSSHPDSTARLWDAADGQSLAVLAGHKNTINGIAFSPDGKRVATASLDQTARLWDGITGQPLAVLRGHTGILWHVVFSPDSTRLVTAADDATLRLWDAQTGELLGVLRGHGAAFAPRCAPVFTLDSSRLVSASHEGTVRIWEMTQVERNVLRGHESFVYDVAFSPDGEQVASAAWDGTARLWDATTGRQTGLLKHETSIITSVSYSRDGLRLATRERDQGVTLWDVASRKIARTWPMRADQGHEPRAAINPAGTLVASGTSAGLVPFWDAVSGREVAQLKGHQAYSTDVAFHPDGGLLASTNTLAHDPAVRLWDVASRAQVAVLRGHTGGIYRVAFSADGKLLTSASGDKTVRLWDLRTRENVAVIPLGSIVYGVAFSPDGTRLAAGSADGSIRLIDVARREQVAELRGHGDYVHAVAWSPDGTRLVSGSGDFTVRVWDALAPAARAERGPTNNP